MAISGFVGAGVQDALSQQLAEQLRQAMFEEEQRQAQAREAMAAREQTRREAEDAAQAGYQTQMLDSQERSRRDRANQAGMEDMYRQRAVMDQEEQGRRIQEVVGAMPDTPVRRVIELQRLGVNGVRPQDTLTPEEQAAARQAEIDDAAAKAGAVARAEAPFKNQPKPHGRVDIRTVQQRGQNGEPGFATLVYRDGILESSHWSPGNPSAAERQGFGDFKTVEEAFRQARDAYKPELVGPVQGRIGNAAQVLPGLREPAGFTDMKSKVAAIQNQLLYLRSGKAISEQEFARMMKELPTETDKDQNFLTKLNNAESLLKTFIENRKAAAGVPTEPVSSHGDGGGGAAPRKPIPGIPGAEAEFRDGRWIRVK